MLILKIIKMMYVKFGDKYIHMCRINYTIEFISQQLKYAKKDISNRKE